MEMQCRFVTKEEVYKMIDEMPDDKIMLLTFNKNTGISDNGKRIKKKKGKIMANKANTMVLCENYPISTVSLHKSAFSDLDERNVDKIIKSLLFAKSNISNKSKQTF